jgi:hypothetical protein
MFDKPIVLLAYRRYEETVRIFEVISQIKPRYFYFVVDYPNNPNDLLLLNENNRVKRIVEKIDWQCEVIKLFFDVNHGPFKAYNKAVEAVFKDHDTIIFLEDDTIPNISFFSFCSELLDYYKFDERIRFISGVNQRGLYPNNYKYDYFFAKNNTSWGHAYWKRTFLKFQSTIEMINEKYFLDTVNNSFKTKDKIYDFKKIIKQYNDKGYRFGQVPSMEWYLLGPMKYLYDSAVIIPSKNLITLVGATEHSENGDSLRLLPKKVQRIFFRENFWIQSPLNHPPHFTIDYNYEPIINPIMKLLIHTQMKFERVIRILILSGPKAFAKKFIKFIRRYK